MTTAPAATTTSTTSTFTEIEEGIATAEDILPVLGGIGATFIPTIGPWLTAAMALLGLVGNALATVQATQGLSLADSITAVAQHLTPGQPNAPALMPAPAVASSANPTG